MVEDILEMLLVFAVVAVPVFGLTARFALKPLLEVVLELRKTSSSQVGGLQAQVRELSGEIELLRRRLARMEESRAFEHELRQPAALGGEAAGVHATDPER